MVRYLHQAWLVLALSLGFGLALAGVSAGLGPIIEKNQRAAREKAALEVVPGGVSAEAAVEGEGGAVAAYAIRDAGGALVGWAVPAQGQGYADTIKLIFGLTPDTTQITGLQILYNQETPGLGNKITEMAFRGQFAGRPGNAALTPVKKHTGLPQDIDAVTGATISSQAICTIINSRTLDGTGAEAVPSDLARRLAALAAGQATAPPAPTASEPLPLTPDDLPAPSAADAQ